MKKIKRIIKKIFNSNYLMRNLFNNIQDLRRKNYYKKVYRDIPVDDKLVLFESFLGKQYACSPKAIYEAMRRDPRYDDFQFVWVFRKDNAKRYILGDERTIVVKYNSRKYFRLYARAKYWVTNWRLSSAIIKKEDQICIQTWHGTPLKKIGLDLNIEGNATTSQKKGHQMYLNDAKKYDYFVSPSAFCTKVFASAFGLNILNKTDILIETGYPRNDFLYRYSQDDIVRIKDELNIPQKEKVILYAPTWRDNQHQLGVGYTFDMSEHIKKFLDEMSKEYIIILRLHYLVANQLDVSAYRGRVIDCSRLDDINQLYVISDMLITDYSSVFFDYANLRRPILFYMYDLKEYESNVRDFYIDLNELPGPIIENEDTLIEQVRNVDKWKDDYKEKYDLFNNKYNYLDDENAGLRVVERCIG